MTRHWRFLDYYTSDGVNLIRDWYLRQDADVQAVFDSVIRELETAKTWDDPDYFKDLHKRHAGLSEIKFMIGKRKFRPVGFSLRDPTEDELGEFAIILGCEKSGRIYEPPNAFDTALELKRLYEDEGAGSLDEHDV